MPTNTKKNLVSIPDDLLTSTSIGACDDLLLLQAEYGGLPVPLPHRAVVQVLELVRRVALQEPLLLSVAEKWEADVLGLHDAQQGVLPAGKSPAVRAPPTRQPPHHHHTMPPEGGVRPHPQHSHSLPSYDTATSPATQNRMEPVTVAPEVDGTLEHVHQQLSSTTLSQVTYPVAPEIDDEHYHSFPQSPFGVQTAVQDLSHVLRQSTTMTATPPLRLPSPVSTCEVSVNVHTQTTTGQSSPHVSVQTLLEMPASPLLTPVHGFSHLPVPAMAPNTPTSERSAVIPSWLSDDRVEALVAAHLNRARHIAGQPLEPVLFKKPAPDLPPLTSAIAIENLDNAQIAAWIEYYIGQGARTANIETLKACIGL